MSECRDNHWQPTFVHDLDRPDGPYYVMPTRDFIKLRGNTGAEWIAHACELIRAYGVRDPRGYRSCQQYTDIQCGCKRGLSEGNTTCAKFLANR